MKILWVTELYPPEKGGVAHSANRIIHNLRASGITVDVLTVSNLSTNTSDDLTPPYKEVEGGLELILKPQIKVPHTLQIMYHNIRRMHHQRNYSIIHGFFGVYAGYVATYAAKMLDLPSVVSFRGNDIDEVIFDYAKKPFLNDTLNWADAISYLSEEMLKSLRIVKPDGKFYFTPNSINHDKYACTENVTLKANEFRKQCCPSGDKLLGIVGEFKFKKGLQFLISMLPEIQKMKATKLLVVGAVSQKDKSELLENPLIIYQPFIPSYDMPSMYASLDFLIIPSLFEGLPNVMLESMYAETINIASDIAGMRDVIENGKNGFKFFPNDKDDFISILQRAYSLTEQEIIAFKKSAKNRATEYTSQRETTSYTDIYKQLC